MKHDATAEAGWAEAHQDFSCGCGHEGYLHDEGLDACAACECRSFVPALYEVSR